jgi:hypothetical protein
VELVGTPNLHLDGCAEPASAGGVDDLRERRRADHRPIGGRAGSVEPGTRLGNDPVAALDNLSRHVADLESLIGYLADRLEWERL